MRLKYFYRIDNKGFPILGSNIKRAFKPILFGKWREIKNACCTPETVNCNCNDDFRYFVQVDGQGNPIDYTLIKRTSKPKGDGIHFLEISRGACC